MKEPRRGASAKTGGYRRIRFERVRGREKYARIAAAAALFLVVAAVVAIFAAANRAPLVAAGDSGAYVTRLQERLCEAGYLSDCAVTGYCGKTTRDAIERYKADHGLGGGSKLTRTVVRSLFGEDADLYLAQLKLARFAQDSARTDAACCGTGDSGDGVSALQTRLAALGFYDGAPSGLYGGETFDAVAAFQNANGLAVTGVADAATCAEASAETAVSQSVYEARALCEAAMAQTEQTGVGAMSYKSTRTQSAYAEIEVWDDKYETYVETSENGNASRVQAENSSELPLSKGSTSDKIKEIQTRLRELGYYTYGDITDYYGSITEAAIVSFQSANGLTASGAVDQTTWDRLFSSDAVSYVAASAAATASAVDPSNLSLGDEHARVAEIQTRLQELGYYTYTSITNYYGTITQSAVRTFQRANGLTADGVCGAATQARLFAEDAVTYEAYVAAGGTPDSARDETIDNLIAFAKQYLGCTYVYGGSGPSTFDCSGFTMYVYRNFGYSFGHGCSAQSNALGAQLSISQLMPGDLVFFDTNGGLNSLEHVGIYIGSGQFIHASSGAGYVTISTLTSGYYNGVFMWGKRVIPL